MANRAATPPSWDFAPIYNLLDNLKLHGDSSDDDIDTKRRPLSPLPRWPSPSRFEPHAIVPRDLGDFNYLYEYLGVATGQNNRSKHLSINSDSSLSSQSFVSSEATHSKTESPPSSLNGDAIQLDDFLDLEDIRRVRWTDEMDGKEFPKLGRSPKNSRVSWQSPPIKNSADFDSDSEVETFRRTHAHNLIPSWVTPQPKLWVPPIPKTFPLPYIIQPIDTLTFEEKWAKLSKKLKHKFGSASSKSQSSALHIFVDCSNIIIGFCNTLKIKRGYPEQKHTKQAPFSWLSFAEVLERGRPVSRRIVVGSNGSPHNQQEPKSPKHILDAEKLGYECQMLEKVVKYKDQTPARLRKGGNGNGYATTSGHSSSEGGRRQKVVSEQGVDEILQMKMLESLVDTKEPATIVLASGDAAEAEYSGGFLKNVERALEKGWHVELVSWRCGLSRDYRSSKFTTKWKGQFTIVELDDFSEELLAIHTDSVRAAIQVWPY